MIVECDHCHTRYNVDEKKVPATGVKVRCQKCQHVLFIQREPAPPPEPEVVVEREKEPEVPEPTEQETPPPEGVEKPTAVPAAEPEHRAAEHKTPEPQIPEPPTPVPPDAVPTTTPEIEAPPEEAPAVTAKPPEVTTEDDKKMHDRARRLAKALASDLVLYNKEKVDAGLRDGTLVKLLGSEIRRSWEYYCQQVPKYIVESTDYFREQLNKIVGKGKEIFK